MLVDRGPRRQVLPGASGRTGAIAKDGRCTPTTRPPGPTPAPSRPRFRTHPRHASRATPAHRLRGAHPPVDDRHQPARLRRPASRRPRALRGPRLRRTSARARVRHPARPRRPGVGPPAPRARARPFAGGSRRRRRRAGRALGRPLVAPLLFEGRSPRDPLTPPPRPRAGDDDPRRLVLPRPRRRIPAKPCRRNSRPGEPRGTALDVNGIN